MTGNSVRATLRDVASAAGVSLATASKALNGRSDVKADTRVRVLEAAEDLQFTPNSVAQHLVSGRTRSVGLITSDLVGRFSLPILRGVEGAFGSQQMSVLLTDAREDSIREQHHVRTLLGRKVDGLIVVGSRTDPRPSLGRHLPVPVVYTYAPSDDPQDLSLICDNVGAGELVTRHLLSLGRRRIAHILGDGTYQASHDRLAGITAALAEAGVELVGAHDMFGSWTESWGRAATTQIMDAHPRVDAIICSSDQIARGCLDSLRERGVTVPGDVAVASFDNWEILATGSRPELTSVDMNFQAMGKAAAEQIVVALDGEPRAGLLTQVCRLAIRGSTVGE
ncbi:LacI family transcriptional regulator [Ruania suaedae]|uniref:LacI family DNA-binding transcriptional regulator n=1 Tax=Ruania suaedae TaxID=2897774 RepID=UPI001E647D29|nr:LacI family DNA-binding transcriptional regulator [Ruania suaedae]UFU03716.1 LacI family transcriptional regulator [Ruania suaedae]